MAISTQINHLVQPWKSVLARILWRTAFSVSIRPLNSGEAALASEVPAKEFLFFGDSARIRRVARRRKSLHAEKQALPENSPGTAKLIFSRRSKTSLPRGSAVAPATTNLL